MSQELAKINEPSVVTPMQLLEKAMAKGVDLEQLTKLMDLQDRWEKNEAKKAYNEAIAAFKRNPPIVIKDMLNKQYNSDYSSLANLVNTVNESLSPHGLNAHWEFDQSKELVAVTCVLTHYMGHSEKVTLSGPPDVSGSKNAIQQIKSTTTYLKAATFEAVTGLASRSANTDDDGNTAGKNIIDPKIILEAEMRGIEYMKNCLKHMAVIDEVKDRLADDDLEAAADTLATLTNKELQSISRAATKGGIFTLEETKKMGKHNEAWQEVWQRAMQNHPEVDRSL